MELTGVAPGRDVLVLNVGSSTVKVQVVDPAGDCTFSTQLEAHPDPSVLDELIGGFGSLGAVGHRVVHGGATHTDAELVTDELLAELDDVATLAPLHDPPAIEVMRTVRRVHPELPSVACYDTAFHATIPAAAHLYAVPAAWEDEWGVRRFGFHGLSHRYASRRAAQIVGRPVEDLRIVTCHLGAGASLAAVAGGRSVDTTMGFSTIAGLVMATRSGDVDPGALLWMQRRTGAGPDRIEDELLHQSGLKGLSRRSGDLREVLAGMDEGDDRCRLAVEVYLHRLRAGIASMVAALGGVDVVVFTGGVGEGADRIRAAAVEGLGFLGLALDDDANGAAVPGRGTDGDADAPVSDLDVSAPGATVRTLVVHAREDLEIDRQVRALLGDL